MVSHEKQYLNKVSVRLGLGGMPNLSALNEILAYVLDGTLLLYFDDDIYGTPIDGSFDQISDTKVMVQGESSTLSGRKTLIVTAQYGTESACHISLAQFIHNKKTYYPVDETGMWLEFRKWNPDSFYCLKNELDTFMDKRNGVKGRRKGETQMKREKALIEYLRYVTQQDDLKPQEYYVAINEPKQETLWAALVKHNPTIFNPTAKEQFFRYLKIIKFKDGTGKYR
jgi:hypothetical protein